MSKFSNSKKIYTVHVEKKSSGGLGFLLRQRHEMPYLGIWEIMKNGSADQCGLIRKGDIILKVNKHDLSTTSYEKGLEIIRSVKADSIVELTLMQNEESEKLNSLRNGLMSPLVKFRKKFMNCTTENNFKKDSIPDHTNQTIKTQYDDVDTQKPLMNNSDTQCNLINGIEPFTPKCLNSIKIIQDGDDIRIKLYDGLEIVTNCANEKRAICLSPNNERKSSTQKENQIDEQKNGSKEPISNKNNELDNKDKSIDLEKTNTCSIDLSPTKQKKKKGLKLKYLMDESNNIDLLHHQAYTVSFFF